MHEINCSARLNGAILAAPVNINNNLPICFNDLPSRIYDSVRAIKRASVVFFLVNKSSTLPGRCFDEKMVDMYLRFYLQTINIKPLFVHMSGNKQSTCTWLGHDRQPGHHVYCLH